MLIASVLAPDPATAKKPLTNAFFSLQANREPLLDVLKKVSKATGYKFEISRGWENRPVTTDFKNASLHEGIQRIIRSMGSPSHAVVMDDRGRKIEIKFFDASSGYPSGNTAVPVGNAQERRQRMKDEPLPDPPTSAPPEFINDEIGFRQPEPG